VWHLLNIFIITAVNLTMCLVAFRVKIPQVSLLVVCLTLHVALATAGSAADDDDEEAENLAPKATTNETQRAGRKAINLGGLLGGGKRSASKGKNGKQSKTVKNKNGAALPRTTIPVGPTVDKRVDFVQPVGQSLPENGGSSSGGWPDEIPNKGKRRKGNRKG
jgi:hypothetical protein